MIDPPPGSPRLWSLLGMAKRWTYGRTCCGRDDDHCVNVRDLWQGATETIPMKLGEVFQLTKGQTSTIRDEGVKGTVTLPAGARIGARRLSVAVPSAGFTGTGTALNPGKTANCYTTAHSNAAPAAGDLETCFTATGDLPKEPAKVTFAGTAAVMGEVKGIDFDRAGLKDFIGPWTGRRHKGERGLPKGSKGSATRGIPHPRS